ncbi:MAG: NIPSNAP family protein, partial [Verrucomicrobiales bacterium]
MKNLTLLLALVATLPFSMSLAAKDSRVFELRTYHAAPGKLDALHARFLDHTVALFEKHGITSIGYWVPVDNETNVLTYIVAYPDREAREKSWQAFKDDPDWKSAYAASIEDGKLVDKIDSTFIQLTPYSMALPASLPSGKQIVELRTYTTNPGKL